MRMKIENRKYKNFWTKVKVILRKKLQPKISLLKRIKFQVNDICLNLRKEEQVKHGGNRRKEII